MVYVLLNETPFEKIDDVERYEGCFCYDLDTTLKLIAEGMRLIGYADTEKLAEEKLQEWSEFI
jgi:hypothetical protein